MAEKNCWVIPIQGNVTEQKYYSLLHVLLIVMQTAGMEIGGETGVLFLKNNDEQNVFIFADIKNGNSVSFTKDPHYLHIDKRDYYCQSASFEIWNKKRDECSKMNPSSALVILTELFNSNFDYHKPDFELRWSINA